MKNTLILVLFALLVGGASAAVSLHLKQQAAPPVVEKSPDDVPVASHVDPHDVAPSAAEAPHHDHAVTVKEPGPDMGVAVRPRAMGVEEILRYGMALKKREELMKQREQSLAQQEAQMKLVFADIQGEQREIEGLRTQIKDQLGAADRKLAELAQAQAKLDADRKQHEEELKKVPAADVVTPLQQENIKRMSAWFQSMDPTKAAGFLKDLCNDGKLDMAVQLLANFEEREAAKVLSSFEEADKALVTEITEAFRDFKRPEPEKKKGR